MSTYKWQVLGVIRSLGLAGGLLVTAAVHAQTITTFAGNGTATSTGDGGAATNAGVYNPLEIATDSSGNVYFTEFNGERIRKVAPNGTITTVVGTGVAGFSGDGGPATSANINHPIGIVVDAAGNLYFADSSNERIRKVTPAGIISTIAGSGAPYTNIFSGDGGPATSATLACPYDFDFDAAGNLYIADTCNNRIRKVNTAGVISTFAGNGTADYSGDGGPATSASLWLPVGMKFDASGNLYFSDAQNNRLRKITPAGIISTVAGSGPITIQLGSYGGDGGPATSAFLKNPGNITFDRCGNLYFGDFSNHRVRKINRDGVISTFAGNGVAAFSGDGGPAVDASLNYPHSAYIDAAGNLYIPDWSNNRVRKIALPACDVTPPKITPIIVGTLGNSNWYRGPVTVGWDLFDGESPILTSTGCGNSALPANTAGTTMTCSATSVGGNASKSVTVKVDSAAPVLHPAVTPNPLTVGGTGTASANATDALSGVSAQSCGALNTASIGTRSVPCSATDFAGNTGTASASYSVRYGFIGFKPPVDNPPIVNLAQAGQTIPLKWQLVNASGTGITTLASVSITVTAIACDSGATLDQVEEYAAGTSTLLNQGGGNYQYNWQTPKSYKNTCQKLTLNLGDGSAPTATFKF